MSRQSSPSNLAHDADDIADRVAIRTTEANFTMTPEEHAGRVVVLNLASTDGQIITLPPATGSGNVYTVFNNVVQTQVVDIKANITTDEFEGVASMVHTTAVATSAEAFYTTATDCLVRWRGTDGTTGGKRGDKLVAIDYKPNKWLVEVTCYTTGTVATPFAAS